MSFSISELGDEVARAVSGVMVRSAASCGSVLSMMTVCSMTLLLPAMSVTVMVRSWLPSASGKAKAKAWSSPSHVF